MHSARLAVSACGRDMGFGANHESMHATSFKFIQLDILRLTKGALNQC